MASITSIRQRDLLVSANNDKTFQGSKRTCITELANYLNKNCILIYTNNFAVVFWTSGRDAGSPSQFVWSNKEVPDSTVVDIFHLDSSVSTCLVFDVHRALSPRSYRFVTRDCNSKHRNLCEVNHGHISNNITDLLAIFNIHANRESV